MGKKVTRKEHKLITGAREALEIARGKKMPAKATLFGWAVWHPHCGLTWNVCGDKEAAWEEAYNWFGNVSKKDDIKKLARKVGLRVVRVKIETVGRSLEQGEKS